MLSRMGDPCKETEDLIDSVAALKNTLETGSATGDLILAGNADACVGVLLKLLDRVGVDKRLAWRRW